MNNLLQETFGDIAKSGHTSDDVDWVGSIDGRYAIDWDGFASIAAGVEYDAGYGGNEIPLDLVVVFSDGSYLSRGEYDGAEWWDYHQTPQRTAAERFELVKDEHTSLGFTMRDFKFAAAGHARSNSGQEN
jgi:hypothetical protein